MSEFESFSLYETTRELAKETGVALRHVSGELPADGGDDRDESFSATEIAMRAWCRRNEKLVAGGKVGDAEVYAGFERFSRIKGVQSRYVQISARATGLWIFGENDYDPEIMRARLVPIESGPLTLEWFLLIHSHDLKALICARDIDGFDNGRPTHERRFEGFKTLHPALVEAVRDRLQDRVGS